MDYQNTKQFINATYKIGSKKKRRLQIGDRVIVHPTPTSQSRKSYHAEIISKTINWTSLPCLEICTFVIGKHTAVMNEYLFNRLEPI